MISKQHELHKRRYGRNVGVGLVLAVAVGLVFGMTVVKVTGGDVGRAISGEVSGQ